ncbi:MAG: hypothetical protein JKX73_06760, partial [Flavobacteriales bacterium]|nr:hypothetical protein [Flavobacteriales bacterium]
FKSSIDITSSGDHEYVSGYAKILRAGVCSNNSGYGWIKLENMKSGDFQNAGALKINPLTWFGLQFAKNRLPEKVYSMSNMDFSGDKTKLARSLLSVIINFTSLATGIDATLIGFGYCKWIDKSKSWVRLLEPSQNRLGGGHRVKSIITRDKWADLTQSGIDAHYGKTYNYTDTDSEGKTISSGVAAYEPGIGGDENTLHKPIFFKHKQSMFYSSLSYVETPLLESKYPAATIGYSRVEVANLKRANVTKHATGKTVSKFHTARNYPIVAVHTEMDRDMLIPGAGAALSVLANADINTTTVSQGHCLYSNDMHGKPISVFNFSESNNITPVSGISYSYYPLGQPLKSVNIDGTVTQTRFGRDIDLSIYSKKQNSQGGSLELAAQIDFNVIGLVPLIAPSGYPLVGFMLHKYASVSTTKTVKDYAQLKSVSSWDMGSKLISESYCFDQLTGQTVTTRSLNQFGDWEYGTQTPAYWQYEQMGSGSKNLGARGAMAINNGAFSNLPLSGLTVGDKLLIFPLLGPMSTANRIVIWVTSLIGNSGLVETKDGTTVPDGTYIYSIINSGHNNKTSITSSETLSLSNPVSGGVLKLSDSVINAASYTFSDLAYKSCKGARFGYCSSDNCVMAIECELDSSVSNSYAWGEKGNWGADETYAYFTRRTYSKPETRDESRTQFDGLYTNYSPYWNNTAGIWSIGADSNWIRSNQVSRITFGQNEVENLDALSNYTSILLGYNQTKVVAGATDARYTELFSDNFEDYGYFYAGIRCFPTTRKHLFDFEIDGCLSGADLGPWGDVFVLDTAETIIDPALCATKRLIDEAHTGLASYVVSCNLGPKFRFPVALPDSCVEHFTLYPEKLYFLSLWVKYPDYDPTVINYDLVVSIELGGYTVSAKQVGKIIEGWAKFETEFRVPSNITKVEMGFNSQVTDSIFIDDLRIHPFNSTVITTVYHPSTLLRMAQLDEGNNATFYEYDQEHQLARINIETQLGILTKQEFYSNLHKKPPRVKGPPQLELE